MATDRIVRIWFQSFRYSDPKSAPAPEHHLRSPACSQAALWTSHQKWGLLCVVTSSREASVPTVRIYLIAASFQLPFRPPQHQPENQIPEHHGGGRPMSSSPQMAAPCSTLGGGGGIFVLSCSSLYLPVCLPSTELTGQPLHVLHLAFRCPDKGPCTQKYSFPSLISLRQTPTGIPPWQKPSVSGPADEVPWLPLWHVYIVLVPRCPWATSGCTQR